MLSNIIGLSNMLYLSFIILFISYLIGTIILIFMCIYECNLYIHSIEGSIHQSYRSIHDLNHELSESMKSINTIANQDKKFELNTTDRISFKSNVIQDLPDLTSLREKFQGYEEPTDLSSFNKLKNLKCKRNEIIYEI